MFVKVHHPKKNAGENNKGSSSNLFNYLNKEDEEKDVFEKAGFFNQDQEGINKLEAIKNIDSNKKKLGKNDYKFYMLTINPTQNELKHLSAGKELDQMDDKEFKEYEAKLKDYSRNVMHEYAKSFNRGITADDLLYYGKLEHQRNYKGTDYEVKQGIAKSGESKKGLQSHIHIVVSRRNKEQDMLLSPITKYRANEHNTKINNRLESQGFNHVGFKNKAEKKFDTQFSYMRPNDEKVSKMLQRHIEEKNNDLSSVLNSRVLNDEYSPTASFMRKMREQEMTFIAKKQLKELNPISNVLEKELRKIKQGIKYSADEL